MFPAAWGAQPHNEHRGGCTQSLEPHNGHRGGYARSLHPGAQPWPSQDIHPEPQAALAPGRGSPGSTGCWPLFAVWAVDVGTGLSRGWLGATRLPLHVTSPARAVLLELSRCHQPYLCSSPLGLGLCAATSSASAQTPPWPRNCQKELGFLLLFPGLGLFLQQSSAPEPQ